MRRSDRQQALAAAKTRVPILLSYSYRTLAEDLARSQDQTTGKFRDRLRQAPDRW